MSPEPELRTSMNPETDLVTYERDMIGYGANPARPKLAGGARVAINS